MILRFFSSLIVFCLCQFGLSQRGGAVEKEAPKWSYYENTSPAFWGDLDPEFSACSDGSLQSPIDLSLENTVVSTAKKERLSFNYQETPLEVEDTGRTLQVNIKTPSSLQKHRQTFRLLQIQFHSPSEHTWKQGHFPLEMHLIHRSLKGETAIVAVFIRQGERNPALAKIFENPPPAGKTRSLAQKFLDPLKLLPTRGGYLSYTGSLTTPPCTEGVTWYVLGSPITASAEQIAVFTSRYPFSARPTHPRGGRRLLIVK